MAPLVSPARRVGAAQGAEEGKEAAGNHFKTILKELEESVSEDEEAVEVASDTEAGTENSQQRRISTKPLSYDKERQLFIYERVKVMQDAEYIDFLQCRQTKVFQRGIKAVLEWLNLKREGTELKFKKVLEAFGYIMRYIVQRIVLQAVKV